MRFTNVLCRGLTWQGTGPPFLVEGYIIRRAKHTYFYEFSKAPYRALKLKSNLDQGSPGTAILAFSALLASTYTSACARK